MYSSRSDLQKSKTKRTKQKTKKNKKKPKVQISKYLILKIIIKDMREASACVGDGRGPDTVIIAWTLRSVHAGHKDHS